jgi:flagellar basal-body rod protein FlgB
MPEPIGQNQTMRMLERSLDLIAQRHQVLLSNIANEETPGYKAKDLDFRAALASAAGPTAPAHGYSAPHARHLPLPGVAGRAAAPTVITLPSSRTGLDGNTVGVEKTMAALHENSTLFAAAGQILSKKYQGLLSALKETR